MYWQRHKSLEERFWEKVLVGDSEDCWKWIGYSGRFGRGVIWNGKRNELAPRLSYRLMRGEIPIGMGVLHKCDNPNCVNPKHLFLGTQKDNVGDAISKGRFVQNSAKRGDQHHFAKLNTEQVKQIHSLASEGMAVKEISSRFHISKSHAHRIVRRQRWASANG